MPIPEDEFLKQITQIGIEQGLNRNDAINLSLLLLRQIKHQEIQDSIFLDIGFCPGCRAWGYLLDDPDYMQIICFACGEIYMDIWTIEE